MPALPPVPGVLKYRFVNTVGSDTNVSWHIFMKTTTSPTQAQASQAAADAHTAWVANIAPLTGAQISLTEIVVTDLTSSSAEVGTWAGASPGTRTGSGPLSAPVSALINSTVHRRYRGGKPRAYIPCGLQGDMSTPQQWSSTFVAAVTNGWNAMAAQLATGLTWASPAAVTVNVAYFQGHEWKGVPPGPYWKVPLPFPGGPHVDVLTGAACNPLIGTQRRRVRPG